MPNTTKEASPISSKINIIQSSADCRGLRETSSRGNITRTTTKVDNWTKLILQDFDLVEESFEAVNRKASHMIYEVHDARNKFKKLMLLPEGLEGSEYELQELKRKVSKLKSVIPFNLIAPPEQANPHVNLHPRPIPEQIKEISLLDLVMRNIERSLHSSRMSLELESVTDGLSSFEKRCFMFILEFPPNTTIKRSLLFSWVSTSSLSQNYLDALKKFYRTMDAIVAKGLIETIYKNDSMTVAGYRMNKYTHETLSCRKWPSPFLYIREGICLAQSLDNDGENIFYTGSSAKFPADKHLKILHLGNWKKSTKQHIEFNDQTELFFKDVSVLTRLEYISLRGISMIQELPKFITKLNRLRFLDLQGCHNLEVIPPEIANLKHTLRYLDMSECYFLGDMPKALATLFNLQVLKGFVVGKQMDKRSCTLEDLVSLKNLVKLNIYTSVKEFPNTSQLTALQKFQKLQSLTISWGGCKSSPRDKYGEVSSGNISDSLEVKPNRMSGRSKSMLTTKEPSARGEAFSFNVEKLDLRCVPETVTRAWLNPTYFQKLKKLYIRGGQFHDIGKQSYWNVEILRLRHLSRFNLDYSEVNRLFPKLMFLENLDCPNVHYTELGSTFGTYTATK